MDAVWAHYGDDETPWPFLKLVLSKVVEWGQLLPIEAQCSNGATKRLHIQQEVVEAY